MCRNHASAKLVMCAVLIFGWGQHAFGAEAAKPKAPSVDIPLSFKKVGGVFVSTDRAHAAAHAMRDEARKNLLAAEHILSGQEACTTPPKGSCILCDQPYAAHTDSMCGWESCKQKNLHIVHARCASKAYCGSLPEKRGLAFLAHHLSCPGCNNKDLRILKGAVVEQTKGNITAPAAPAEVGSEESVCTVQ